MKLPRAIFGALGLSTLHLHNSPILNPNSLSKVVPTINGNDLLADVIKQEEKNKKLDFKIIAFEKDDPLPVLIFIKNNNRIWSRPPRSITATHKPIHTQSKHRLR